MGFWLEVPRVTALLGPGQGPVVGGSSLLASPHWSLSVSCPLLQPVLSLLWAIVYQAASVSFLELIS
jgi:hypothetical protein